MNRKQTNNSESLTQNPQTPIDRYPVDHSVGGDGKGVFFADMDPGDYEQYQKEEEQGWAGFYKRIKNIGK